MILPKLLIAICFWAYLLRRPLTPPPLDTEEIVRLHRREQRAKHRETTE